MRRRSGGPRLGGSRPTPEYGAAFSETFVSSAGDDPEQFFNRMRPRFDAVRLDIPKIEVRFQNLKVEAFVHVGSRALPTIPNFVFNMTEALSKQLRIYRGQRSKLTILDNISGIVRPSRLTLQLGPPSSGKTTLILALAGRLGSGLQPHLSFKEVSNPQKHNLFISKLNLCCEFVDSSDPVKQDLRRETLIELVDYVSSGTLKFTEQAISAVCKMCPVNLFKVFPPKCRSNFTGGETENEEPMFDPAWSYLQIVYDLQVRFVSYSSVEIKVAEKHVDHSFIVK